MILGSTIPLATKEAVIAWNGERCSSWAAETALQDRSGILLARHIWKDNGPATARAIGAKRKTRIANILCRGRGDWEMFVDGGLGSEHHLKAHVLYPTFDPFESHSWFACGQNRVLVAFAKLSLFLTPVATSGRPRAQRAIIHNFCELLLVMYSGEIQLQTIAREISIGHHFVVQPKYMELKRSEEVSDHNS